MEQIKKQLHEQQWHVEWEYKNDVADALIHERQPGSRILYGIATVEDVPVNEVTGELVREGEESDRLREVCLLAHAPDLLNAVRQAAVALDEITGLTRTDDECGKWINDKATEQVWRKLCEIQDRLDRTFHDAQDTDNV
jgi:hypothetical protein